MWVSFPRATSEGFSFSRLTAGVELRAALVELRAAGPVILFQRAFKNPSGPVFYAPQCCMTAGDACGESCQNET